MRNLTQLALAKAGWEAIAVNYSSNAEDAEKVVDQIISTTNAKAKAFKADLGSVAACVKLVDDIVAEFGEASWTTSVVAKLTLCTRRFDSPRQQCGTHEA